MVQPSPNRIPWRCVLMSSQAAVYKAKNVVLKIERIYKGDKTIKELILEMLQKRYKSAGSRSGN